MTWIMEALKLEKHFSNCPPNSRYVVTKWFLPSRKFAGNPAVPKQGIMEPLLAWDFS